MKTLLPAVGLIFVALAAASAWQRAAAEKPKPVIVAFVDEERVKSRPEGETTLENFHYFLNSIREIAKRDFPNVDFKVATAGDFVALPDGTGLNVQNLQPALGYVFAEQGRKRVVLSGVQSDKDFACAAAAFFRRASRACSK